MIDFRAIFVAVFAIVGDRSEASNTAVVQLYHTLGSPTLLCVLGNRLFFNLKEAAEHGVNVGTSWSSYSGSAIYFEEPLSSNEQ